MRAPWWFLFLFLIPAGVLADAVTVADDLWSRPRESRTVAHLPGLSLLIAAFERQPHGLFVIRHGSGEEPQLRAEEFRAWLVSFGLPSARVLLERDPAAGGQLRLEVRTGGSRP
ncbi:MAG: hypothetical protein A2140_08345 [Candidatus Muproteobacteria bacterium RBG_16_62_13]|uniref:Uncharacterized protein n=1 Tax=Candidatus Muproteobacteria bacterium RBG_16_62_13 TaxID=1817756 RepID=A0A1F6SXT5_9PROT|nr:MAG: hypothetical protein A2140_08345 [Candidatus Muproteobacteria bacterium RBG_16_62_13]